MTEPTQPEAEVRAAPRPSPIKVDALLREAAKHVIVSGRSDNSALRRELNLSFGMAAALLVNLRTLGIVDAEGKVLVPAAKLQVVMGALMRHQHVGDVLAADAVADKQAQERWLPARRQR